jgi:hypothetical protein
MVEPKEGFFFQHIGLTPGVDPSPMESLIGIYISHSSQESLVQKEWLDRPMFFPCPVGELFGRQFERLRAQGCERTQPVPSLLLHANPAELTLVCETKLAGMPLKRKDYMGMLFRGRMRGDEPQPSGHTQMNEQGHPAAQVKNDIFPPAFYAKDPSSFQGCAKRLFRTRNAFSQAYFNLGKLQVFQFPPQTADDGFYFWQLGHD